MLPVIELVIIVEFLYSVADASENIGMPSPPFWLVMETVFAHHWKLRSGLLFLGETCCQLLDQLILRTSVICANEIQGYSKLLRSLGRQKEKSWCLIDVPFKVHLNRERFRKFGCQKLKSKHFRAMFEMAYFHHFWA